MIILPFCNIFYITYFKLFYIILIATIDRYENVRNSVFNRVIVLISIFSFIVIGYLCLLLLLSFLLFFLLLLLLLLLVSPLVLLHYLIPLLLFILFPPSSLYSLKCFHPVSHIFLLVLFIHFIPLIPLILNLPQVLSSTP